MEGGSCTFQMENDLKGNLEKMWLKGGESIIKRMEKCLKVNGKTISLYIDNFMFCGCKGFVQNYHNFMKNMLIYNFIWWQYWSLSAELFNFSVLFLIPVNFYHPWFHYSSSKNSIKSILHQLIMGWKCWHFLAKFSFFRNILFKFVSFFAYFRANSHFSS